MIATLSARMQGWNTKTFPDKVLIHYRQQGTADSHKLLVELHNGRKDYMFGGHPLWEMFRAGYRLSRKPVVLGGCLLMMGYLCAMLSGTKKTVSPDIVKFRRREQMQRLTRLLSLRGATS